MKKILTIFFCMILLFGLYGCDVNKPILYRYDIEDIDYNNANYKAYYIEYTTEVNGFSVQVSVRLELNSDGKCQYYSTEESDPGTTVSQVDSSCTYQIKDKKILVKIDSVKQIYNPSYSAKKLGFKTSTTYETNVMFDGKFSDNGKFLTIGNLKYKNNEYLNYLEQGISKVLVDPISNRTYKLDGTPAFNSDPDYVRKNKLNLSKYQIIDKKIDNSDEQKNENINDITIDDYLVQLSIDNNQIGNYYFLIDKKDEDEYIIQEIIVLNLMNGFERRLEKDYIKNIVKIGDLNYDEYKIKEIPEIVSDYKQTDFANNGDYEIYTWNENENYKNIRIYCPKKNKALYIQYIVSKKYLDNIFNVDGFTDSFNYKWISNTKISDDPVINFNTDSVNDKLFITSYFK